MRYYVYVSATKVDLLVAQIPDKALSRIATTLTVDLKLVKAEFAGKERQRTLYSQLELVERFLEEEELVGTLEEPRSYIRAQMPLRWGPLGDQGDDQFIYFGGETEQTILGLGGSMAHVVGQSGGADVGFRGSALPFLLEGLGRELRSRSLLPDMDMDIDKKWAAETVERMTLGMSGQPQQMEFLAKYLFLAKDRLRRDVLLGTPLYVALID